jgi:hypothetical protein
MATFHCGLCDRVSKESACRCYMGPKEYDCADMPGNNDIAEELIQAAWSLCRNVHIVKSTGAVPGSLRERIGELRRVLERIEDANGQQCELCDGHGGYAIVGSSGPGQVCPKCAGSGFRK